MLIDYGYRTTSYVVMDGDKRRCFLCGERCYSSCLEIKDSYGVEVVCGLCVYYNENINRPSCNIKEEQFKRIKEKNEKIAEKNKIRERRRRYRSFCCETFGKFLLMQNEHKDYVKITDQGRMRFVEHSKDCDGLECCYGHEKITKHKKFDFKFCPFCRKKFIRRKEQK